jgi:hypothetical protein
LPSSFLSQKFFSRIKYGRKKGNGRVTASRDAQRRAIKT